MITKILKRDGTIADFDAEKLNKWAVWSAGIGVEWGSVALGACRRCFDGCTTEDLHNALIAECVDRETNAHLRMAGRLFIGQVYKKTFGDWENLPTVAEMYAKMIGLGLWDSGMNYSQDELAQCQGFINHSLDMHATLTEVKQSVDKYAINNRVDKIAYESPQFIYMRMALGAMMHMDKERRMSDVKKLYEGLSQKKINPATPFSINLGTPRRQYASCAIITTEDSAASLATADHAAYMLTTASAGIGVHLKTRSKGDKVRGGLIQHQGKVPYIKVQQAVVQANMQNSRGGASTLHYNCLDPEIKTLLRLKNVQSVEALRVKDIDYSFSSNALFAQKVAKNERWMLVSYGDAPELYEAMYSGCQEEFVQLYAQIEADSSVPKEFIQAREIAVDALREGYETGRIYLTFVDEMNRHTPFIDKIYSSNLCQEVSLPTKGYNSVQGLYSNDEGAGEIAVCSLGAISATTSDEEYEQVAYSTLLMIDNVITLMDYPFPQLKVTAQARRSIGVGITNLAYALASKNLKYSSVEGKRYIARLSERHAYWLYKASLRLAKEQGNAEWICKTKIPGGWLPIDTANKEVEAIVGQPLLFDWEALRAEIVEQGGIRNSVLVAHMPCESSSVASGHTNGLYPVRGLKVIKTSGTSKSLFIAPEAERLEAAYEMAWDIPTKDMVEVYATIQRFTCQGISADMYVCYDAEKRSVGTKEMLSDFLYMKKLGMSSRYYINSKTRSELQERQEEAEPECEACSM